MGCNNYNNCCGGKKGGLFEGYEAFWIVVILAIVIIWVQSYGEGKNNNCGHSCGCNNNCGNVCC